jgi:hypothetical protein
MKIVMMELAGKALKEKFGLDYDIFTMEKKGIKKILEENNLKREDLGIRGATLVYRRSAREMPLKQPNSPAPEDVEKAGKISEKLLNNYREKFLFDFIPNAVPVDFEEKNGKLTALILEKTRSGNGKLINTGERFRHETPQVISSIGSIPVKLKGIPYDGDKIKTADEMGALVYGYKNLFAVGNAVTGQGNIKMAKEHGRNVTEKLIHDTIKKESEKLRKTLDPEYIHDTDKRAESIADIILHQPLPTQEEVEHVWELVEQKRKEIGYTDYDSWIRRHKPVRLEEILKRNKN